jgi:hypothetical protein
LRVGNALANIIFVVGDEGVVVVDTTEAVSAAKRIYEDFCAIDKRYARFALKAVVYTQIILTIPVEFVRSSTKQHWRAATSKPSRIGR